MEANQRKVIPMSDDALVPQFSAGVHASMLQLRKDAANAGSLAEWRKAGRYATAEEIALSEALRRPTDCAGHSARTGLACRKPRCVGMTVCRQHGGNLKKVKAKAAIRIAKMVDPMLGRMQELAMQDKHLPTAFNAAKDALDRAGIGEPSEVARAKSQREGGSRIEVHIGFLNPPATDSGVVVVEGKTLEGQKNGS